MGWGGGGVGGLVDNSSEKTFIQLQVNMAIVIRVSTRFTANQIAPCSLIINFLCKPRSVKLYLLGTTTL